MSLKQVLLLDYDILSLFPSLFYIRCVEIVDTLDINKLIKGGT